MFNWNGPYQSESIIKERRLTMSANILSNGREHEFELAFESPKKLEWVVRKNSKLQAELNGQPKNGMKLSSKVVHKVVDCIKDL
jgi:hypothetical protein